MSYKLQKPYTNTQRADFVVQYNHKQGLLIEETNTALYALEPDEIMQDGEPVKNPDYKSEQLAELKAQKLQENLDKAYEAEQNGLILYKGAQIETTTANVAKLTSQFAMLSAGMVESVQWLSKDDIQLELTAQDLTVIGAQIAEYTSALWNVHYLAFKAQIEACTTVEEVNAIVIDYAKDSVIENQPDEGDAGISQTPETADV